MIFQIRPMWRAWEAFKTDVLKNAYKKNLDQKLKFDKKKKRNVGLKNLNFEFLVNGGGFKLKKKNNIFYSISFQNKRLVSLLEKIPHLIFFSNAGIDMSIYNFLLLRPCTLVVLQRSQKTFRILYQLIKLLLNFG